jgi:hypothetical protein
MWKSHSIKSPWKYFANSRVIKREIGMKFEKSRSQVPAVLIKNKRPLLFQASLRNKNYSNGRILFE